MKPRSSSAQGEETGSSGTRGRRKAAATLTRYGSLIQGLDRSFVRKPESGYKG